MSHADVQKHICYKNDVNNFDLTHAELHKTKWVYYVPWLEMDGRIFSSFLLYYILVHFVMRIQFMDNIQNYPKEWHALILLHVITESNF